VGAQPVDEPELALPRPPGVIRRWFAAHPKAVDRTIVVVYLLSCVAVGIIGGIVVHLDDVAEPLADGALYLRWPGVLLSAVLIAAVATVLWFRRKIPLVGVIVIAIVLWVFNLVWFSPQNWVALFMLLYAVPVYRSVKSAWLAYGLVLSINIASALLLWQASGPGLILRLTRPVTLNDLLTEAVSMSVLLLVPVMIGINVGNRKRYLEALIDRARQLAREREQRARLAAASERARIAREMHDIVAHSLSVVVTLNEAAAVSLESHPQAARQALERSAETGRDALIEMRRLLGVLAEDSPATDQATGQPRSEGSGSAPELAPQPGLSQLPSLFRSMSDAGLILSVTEEGEPIGDSAHQLTVYRIVQEALTNVLRHAGVGVAVSVTLQHGLLRGSERVTRIDVHDAGATPSRVGEPVKARSGIPGSGRGLAGAQERAHLFGGRITAGPEGEGWRVIAEIPVVVQLSSGHTDQQRRENTSLEGA